jgi:transcriptional regulator with XRE-family HTH domain
MERLIFPLSEKEAKKAGINYSSADNRDAVFPSLLRSLREEKKISQAALAKEIGITKSTIGLYETGDNVPDVKTLSRLADFYDVSADYLLGRIGCPSPKIEERAIYEKTGLPIEAIKFFAEAWGAKDFEPYEITPFGTTGRGKFNFDHKYRGFAEVTKLLFVEQRGNTVRLFTLLRKYKESIIAFNEAKNRATENIGNRYDVLSEKFKDHDQEGVMDREEWVKSHLEDLDRSLKFGIDSTPHRSWADFLKQAINTARVNRYDAIEAINSLLDELAQSTLDQLQKEDTNNAKTQK